MERQPARTTLAFAAHDEGDGVLSLFARPFRMSAFAAAVDRLGIGDELVDVTPAWEGRPAARVGVDRLSAHRAPIELLHCPDGDPAVDATLLLDPHSALTHGRRLAFSLEHRDHGVVWTRDVAVVRAMLAALFQDVAGTPPEGLVTALSEPIADEEWREVRCADFGVQEGAAGSTRRGRSLFEVTTQRVDDRLPRTLERVRYIGRAAERPAG